MAESLQSLSKGLQVYKEIVHYGQPILAMTLCERLNMNKSTMSRILQTLKEEGYIAYLENSNEVVPMNLYHTINQQTTIELLIQKTKPLLETINNLTSECAYLGIFDNQKVLYINQINHNTRKIKTRNNIGLHAPLHTNALGKSILAFGNYDLNTLQLNAYTHNTITDIQALKQTLDEVKTKGYSIDNSEFEDNMCCVATPLFNHENILIGAVGISGSKTRLTQSLLDELGESISKLVEDFKIVC